MTETRAITFRQLKANCCWDKVSFGNVYCLHEDYGYMGTHCLKKNCPVWKGLKEQ